MAATIIEYNNIFLHGRMLLLMYGVSKASTLYRVNNGLNLLTFVSNRLVMLIIMVRMASEDCDRMTPFWCRWVSLVLVVLLLTSVVLFYRLLKSDFWSKSDRSSHDTDIMKMQDDNNHNQNGEKMNLKSSQHCQLDI